MTWYQQSISWNSSLKTELLKFSTHLKFRVSDGYDTIQETRNSQQYGEKFYLHHIYRCTSTGWYVVIWHSNLYNKFYFFLENKANVAPNYYQQDFYVIVKIIHQG